MNSQFKDQGGMAGMDPSAPVRWLTSKAMTRMADLERRDRKREKAERDRQKAGRPHVIEYFHQPGDGYSHLAAQLLAPLQDRYSVQVNCHLVSAESGRNLPEPELLASLSVRDSAAVAAHYGLKFPNRPAPLDPQGVALAERILAAAGADEFPACAVAVGESLHNGDSQALVDLSGSNNALNPQQTAARVSAGNALRARLGHYSGAMFFYAGEWYWGADRFYHLERRLMDLGARRNGTDGRLICPRPDIVTGPARDNGSLTLEIYPSLRSPYTSMIFDTALSLGETTGVTVVVRPVLPMVMRGVPATRKKGSYIVFDTAREAQALGIRWGERIYDPIGQPVRNAYSLYPWARDAGKGNALLSSFMHAAFVEGVNTNTAEGLRRVVERAGLDWAGAAQRLNDPAWEAELEANRQLMYEFGSWGVPSFRLLDREGREVLALWGQDRLWLFAREIQRLLGT